MTEAAVKRLPKRTEVPEQDTWDLSSLFPSDEAWEQAFQQWVARIPEYEQFRGRLGQGADQLAECLEFDLEMDRLGERLGCYAFLKTAEDTANSRYQEMRGRFMHAAAQAAEAASFIRPELMAVPEEQMEQMLQSPRLEPYRLLLERILRYRPHTLSPGEERLLAMQLQMSETAPQVFRQLNDADLKFPSVRDEKGQEVPLSHANFAVLLRSPERQVRKEAFHKYYGVYRDHQNTLAATLGGAIQRDVYYARARRYPSALEKALFPDNVPVSVYDNLIQAVRDHLPALHKYYEVRRRAMKLDKLHVYDTYVPILAELEKRHTWDEAVEVILEALAPLGPEYQQVLEQGLRGRWCDRYENQGKQSGAFSYGTYDGDPYILMNYKEEVLDHVFTLAHEAGHSMHSWYSSRHQPFQYYNYTIFVAEVASTFNEELLFHHLLQQAKDPKERAYLINREIDDIRGTLIRQTMFAEFEKITHQMAEQGQALTLEAFCRVYHELLEAYFGPDVVLDAELDLECFRIPHFYHAFYVYKYATGMSAAIALSRRVLSGGEAEREAYLNFLKGGCSKDPLDLLRDAGVDMETPEPVNTALDYFAQLVDELEELLGVGG